MPLVGAQFTNNTGVTITSLDIGYTGEQWRLGQNSAGRAADRLDFQLSTDATSLTTGTWANDDTLDFASPLVAGTVGAQNGNAATNRTAGRRHHHRPEHPGRRDILDPLGRHGPHPGRR